MLPQMSYRFTPFEPGGRQTRVAFFAVALLMLGLGTAACGDDAATGGDASAPCTDESDCPYGYECAPVGGELICVPRADAGAPVDAQQGAPRMVLSATELDFGAPLLGTPVTEPLVISNEGDADLHITDLLILEDDDLDEYRLDAPAARPIVVAPGDRVNLGVILQGADAEPDFGYLLIASNDEQNAAVLVTLTSESKGTPQLGVCVNAPPAPLTDCVSPTTFDYGTVPYGGTATRVARLRNLNAGNAVLTVDDIDIPTPPVIPSAYFAMDLFTVEEDSQNPGSYVEIPATLPYLLAPQQATADLYLRLTFTADIDRTLPDLVVAITTDATQDDVTEVPIIWQVDGCPTGWVDLDAAVPGCEYSCPVWPTTAEACNNTDDDCNGIIDNGFDLTSDSQNCGYCGHACNLAHATSECQSSLCVITACESTAATGWINLNGNLVDGCEHPCPVWPTTAEACNELDDDCDGDVDEGFNLVNDPQNCGSCGHVCPSETPYCSGSTCVLTCPAGTTDCSGSCVDLDTDPEHCGSCGTDCTARYDNAQGTCISQTCVMGNCDAGFENINGSDGDGCEYPCPVWPTVTEVCNGQDDDCDGAVDETFDKQNDPLNCGTCGNDCTDDYAHAAGLCTNGACQMGACEVGYRDLENGDSDGCEYPCPEWPPVAETCNGQDDNCDGNIDEGFDKLNDPLNCGTCGNDCTDDYANALGICVNGHCQMGACLPGFANHENGDTDGCEYECPVWPAVAETCNGKDDNCDGNIDEAFDKQNDPLNCGTCGTDCTDDYANAAGICVAGFCQMGACEDGWRDNENGDSDGCEYECRVWPPEDETCNQTDDDCDGLVDESFDFLNDPLHCGDCFTDCTLPGTQVECRLGLCEEVGCLASYYDIDGPTTPGCEYHCPTNPPEIEVCNETDDDCDGDIDEGFDLTSNPNHCGSCTTSCGSDQLCCSSHCEDSDVDNCGYCGRPCAGLDPCFKGTCIYAGVVVISELMINPAAVPDNQGEWVELYNITGYDINLNGWVLRDDDSDTHTIVTDVWVPAHGYAVLGNNANFATNGGVVVDYQYAGFILGQDDDEVVLEADGIEVDRFDYPSNFDASGKSQELGIHPPDASANDSTSNWCDAVSPYGSGDLGTPGTENDCIR